MQFIRRNIQYCSDLHLEYGFKRLIIPKKPYLLLAGDIGYPFLSSYKEFLHYTSGVFDKVFVLPGNHEYDFHSDYSTIDNKIKDICNEKSNLIFMNKNIYNLNPDTLLVGATLWSEKPMKRLMIHLDHTAFIKNTVLTNKDKQIIIFTHHSPLYNCIDAKYSLVKNYFASDNSELIKYNNNIKVWIYGHTHNNIDMQYNGCYLLSNQYGRYINPVQNYKYIPDLNDCKI